MRSPFVGRMPLGNTILCIYFFVLHSFKTPLFYYSKVFLSLFIVGGRSKSIMSFASILRRGSTCVGILLRPLLPRFKEYDHIFEQRREEENFCRNAYIRCIII